MKLILTIEAETCSEAAGVLLAGKIKKGIEALALSDGLKVRANILANKAVDYEAIDTASIT